MGSKLCLCVVPSTKMEKHLFWFYLSLELRNLNFVSKTENVSSSAPMLILMQVMYQI